MNKTEKEILMSLLRSEEALSLSDLSKMHPEILKNTISSSLAKLLREEYIEVDSIVQVKKVFGRTYRPTKAGRNAILQYVSADVAKVSCFVEFADLFASFYNISNKRKLTQEDVSQLKDMLHEFELEHNLTENS